jgi:hypothetical protein
MAGFKHLAEHTFTLNSLPVAADAPYVAGFMWALAMIRINQ